MRFHIVVRKLRRLYGLAFPKRVSPVVYPFLVHVITIMFACLAFLLLEALILEQFSIAVRVFTYLFGGS